MQHPNCEGRADERAETRASARRDKGLVSGGEQRAKDSAEGGLSVQAPRERSLRAEKRAAKSSAGIPQTGEGRPKVSLVGAGPGAADLLTVRAARRLAEADVVLFDALVSAETLALAPRARKIPVGKRAGRPSASQEVINRLLVQLAQRGERVVRLKGGDPFVFGRGGEEAEALAAAGIPFEIVPGISSALAAPALANIPVTHRGLVSSFVVLSGASVARIAPMLSVLPPGEATLVVLMGVAARKEIAESLLARGWDAQTPCALLAGASTPDESQWFGSLSALGEAPAPAEHLPGTLVIGSVVSLAASLAASNLSQGAPHVLDR